METNNQARSNRQQLPGRPVRGTEYYWENYYGIGLKIGGAGYRTEVALNKTQVGCSGLLLN